MAISFIRIDDRMIHGQTCISWARKYPMDGIVLVNDYAANTPILKTALRSASNKKTFIWTIEEWQEKKHKVIESKDNYFLITKEPETMKKILVDDDFDPDGVRHIVIGPCNEREGTINVGNNQCLTMNEAKAIEDLHRSGFTVEFALVQEESIGTWERHKHKFDLE